MSLTERAHRVSRLLDKTDDPVTIKIIKTAEEIATRAEGLAHACNHIPMQKILHEAERDTADRILDLYEQSLLS